MPNSLCITPFHASCSFFSPRDLSRYIDFELFEKQFSSLSHRYSRETQMTTRPKTDIRENEDAVLIEMDLPGLKSEDVNLTLEQNNLHVTAERNAEGCFQKGEYYINERAGGVFERSFNIADCDKDKISASMQDGSLTITIPKKPEAKTKKIAIRTG